MTVLYVCVVLAAVYSSVSAQNGTVTTGTTSSNAAIPTVNLYLGPGNGPATDAYVASVVHADQCMTTYAVHCTPKEAGEYMDGTVPWYCVPQTVTRTYGPRFYGRYDVGTYDYKQTTYTISESCSLRGTSAAVCAREQTVEDSGNPHSTSELIIYTGTDAFFAQVPITAGTEKLSNLAACTSRSSGAAPAATGTSRVYKMVVIPGAAAILTGLVA